MTGLPSLPPEPVPPARILVVEDERLIALHIQRTLTEFGYALAGCVARGDDAVRKARAVRPDLVLMDIHLLGPMDGIQAATVIQEELHIPVIYLSAFADSTTMRRARTSAPFGYLVKPLKPAELVCAVEVALGRWQVEENALQRQVSSRAIEEITRARLLQLLGPSLMEQLPLLSDRSFELVKRAAERQFEHRQVDLPTGPVMHSALTSAGGAVRVVASHPDRFVTQEMSLGDVGPEPAAATLSTASGEHEHQQQRFDALATVSGGVAHDLNNILAAIMVNGYLLLDSMDADDPRCEEVEEISKAVARGAALTRQLQAFSHRQVLQPSFLDLSAVVRSMDKTLRRIAGKDIELSLRLSAGLGRVKADRGQIEQVITNLVANACEAMPEGGRLTIETGAVELDRISAVRGQKFAPGTYVTLSIGDSGCGMDESTKSRAFEPFFTTKDRGRATGLGLSTVQVHVELSGGYVSLQSEPGRGTVVTVHLPRDQDRPATGPIAISDLTLDGSEVILLLEDDAGVRTAIGKVLVSNGYRVLMARSGDEALELGGRHVGPIDLILADLLAPDASGPEIARRLSATRQEPAVLFMSGHTDHTVPDDGSLPDSKQYIQKPFAPEALLRKVRDILDRRRPPQAGGRSA